MHGRSNTGAMRQRILGSHTPPCHRRMVITTQFNVSECALLHCSADLFSTTLGGLCLCVGCLYIRVSSHQPLTRGGGGGAAAPVSVRSPLTSMLTAVCSIL